MFSWNPVHILLHTFFSISSLNIQQAMYVLFVFIINVSFPQSRSHSSLALANTQIPSLEAHFRILIP
jgi:hypothetical protein